MTGIRVSNNLTIPDDQLQWSYARSSGPGGQNVNKVNSKATLRWKLDVDNIPAGILNRFREHAKRYLTTADEVVIQSQEHRDQAKNVLECRNKLRTLLRLSLHPPKVRKKTAPSRASKQRRLNDKKRVGDKKAQRRFRPGPDA